MTIRKLYPLLIVFLLTSCQPSGNAIQFHNDPARTGVYDTKGVPAFTEVLWKFQTGGEVWSSPILANGLVYFGSNDKNFYAVDAKKGTEKWRFQVDGEVRTAAAIYAGKVYFTDLEGALYALNAQTGEEIWKLDMQEEVLLVPQMYDEYTSSPLIVEDVIYVGSLNAKRGFMAVDAQSGEPIWNFAPPMPDIFRGPASYSGGRVYVGGGNQLFALDAKTGQSLFQVDIGGSAYYAPAIADGTVFFSSKDTNLYAVDAVSGAVKWKKDLAGSSWVTSSPVVVNGMVYAGTSDGRALFALSASTGDVQWVFQTRGWTWSSPVYAQGLLYVGSYNKKIYAIDAVSGEEKWSYLTEGPITSSPLVWVASSMWAAWMGICMPSINFIFSHIPI